MADPFASIPLSAQAKTELTPTGELRAAINMSNPLLVTSRTASGDPAGVSPDMAAAIAERLGVPLKLLPYRSPGELADAIESSAWDIGLIGAEPQRAEKIAFTPPYAEIEATYLVPGDSAITTLAEVDRPGIRIAVSGRRAYGLWLERNIIHATLVRGEAGEDIFGRFVSEGLDVYAGLHTALLADQQRLPGSRILDGHFATVQQAIGTARANEAAASFLRDVVAYAKSSGFVRERIVAHGVDGRLHVAGTIS